MIACRRCKSVCLRLLRLLHLLHLLKQFAPVLGQLLALLPQSLGVLLSFPSIVLVAQSPCLLLGSFLWFRGAGFL